MQRVGAVVTTGVYCRPGCGGNPLPSNKQPFLFAAAAEAAGYRSCHRCRPYRTSTFDCWDGPEIVCRAVRMILDGYLDTQGELALGRRLGVSARHLRRLFHTHLGVTPTRLARSARAHFARRLLDDTDLSATEIAFAAGFQSVRQFNRTMREIFRESPTELRARRRLSDRLVADGGLPLRIPLERAIDWDAMLVEFAAHTIPGVSHVDDRVYRRTIVVDGDPGVLELTRGQDERTLLLTLHLPHWTGLIHLVERARHVVNLQVDPRPSTLRSSSTASSARQAAGTWDPFEASLQVIVEAMSPAPSREVLAAIVQQLGCPVAGLVRMGVEYTFPPPDVVATADLTGVGLTDVQAQTLGTFAARVVSGELVLDRSLTSEQLVSALVETPGVDESTACRIARCLGESVAFDDRPHADEPPLPSGRVTIAAA